MYLDASIAHLQRTLAVGKVRGRTLVCEGVPCLPPLGSPEGGLVEVHLYDPTKVRRACNLLGSGAIHNRHVLHSWDWQGSRLVF